jgi:di/tricarboxylate transporter
MTQYGMPPLGMFELTGVGLPIVIVGLVYMFFIGNKLIPVRKAPEELTEEFNLRPYLTEVIILPNSPLIGKSLVETGLGRELDLTIIRIRRGAENYMVPDAAVQIQPGDALLLEGQRDNLLRLISSTYIGVESDQAVTDVDLQTKDMRLAEVILLPRSSLIGRVVSSLELRSQYGVQVLAINRHEETIHNQISQVRLRLGDVLLVQGPQASLISLERDNTYRILGTVDDRIPNQKRARLALVIFIAAIACAALNLISLPVAVLLGALMAFLTRCITPQEAYNDVEWRALILIGCMLAFGTAMEYTGTASYLANNIVDLVGEANPVWLLGGFFLLTVALTQPMSNQAAAVVIFPVAIQTALQLGLNPRTFAIMIAIAASTSYLTPLEPACLLVYGLGQYRFVDFIRVGFLLTIFVFLIAIFLVPKIWPI